MFEFGHLMSLLKDVESLEMRHNVNREREVNDLGSTQFNANRGRIRDSVEAEHEHPLQ